ncbi:MAG: ABC transporter permease [Candidatus Bathyarchaeota archaeon]|nr:ABC transporter permease [Candidatus Bathyarchaeota archaeon]
MVLLKGLFNIIVKEVKELVRDPKILLPMIIIPLIMFPLMGFAIQTSMEAAEGSMKEISVAVMDLDGGPVAESLRINLTDWNAKIVQVDDPNLTKAINYVQESNLTGLIVIPSGFSQNITEGGTSELEVYTPYRGGGITESTSSSAVSALLSFFENNLVDQRIDEKFTEPPTTVLNPIDLSEKSIIKGKGVDVPPTVLFGLVMSQSTIMPVGIMMLLIFAMQLAATAVASEKEEKTLETLLTLPINRFMILAGKLTGSIIVAVVGAVAYLIGFSYYMNSFTGMIPTEAGVDLAAIGLAPTLLSYSLLGLSLFMALLSALALAISISVFAEDVRGAQALVGPLSILFVFPMIFSLFTDIYALPFPLSIILLAIPFTHPMLAANVAFTGNYLIAIGGIVYMAIFTVAVLYIAARLFGTEKILTAKLKFKRFSLRKKK